MNNNIRIDREEKDADNNSIFFCDKEVLSVLDGDGNILEFEYDIDTETIIIEGDYIMIYAMVS